MFSGGGVYAVASNVSLQISTFVNNTATDFGGAVYAFNSRQIQLTVLQVRGQ